ncbi:hypothetical protein [Micromonospora musae]|uniref:hypothetical protein n=1 Tax=Micromonospora musae TaxID=1894970 RepID=UPI0033F05F1A
MGTFKTLVDGEPTSAVGTAYVPVEEKYTRELGMYHPGDQRVILLSGASGTITDPDTALDTVFGGLPSVTDVEPIQPGPLGDTAKCGISQGNAVRVDVCAWADDHTIGMATFVGFPPDRNPPDLFQQIRAQLEHPNA